jgi:hypothetical protein
MLDCLDRVACQQLVSLGPCDEITCLDIYLAYRNCGDQDSIGVFQQRPSQGWGSYAQIMDVNYSTGKVNISLLEDRECF